MDQLISYNITTLIYTILTLIGIGVIYLINKAANDFLSNLVKVSIKKIVDFITGEKIDISSQEIINSINIDLAELRIYTNADRAYVLEFHNGSEYLSRFPQWKLSQSYEKNAPGISYEGYEFQNIPATLIWDDYLKIFFDENTELPNGITKIKADNKCPNICGEKSIFIIDVEKLNYDLGPLRNILEKRGVKILFQVPIFSKINKSIIGIVGLDFMDYIDINNVNECLLCKFSSQLSFLWGNINSKEKILKHHLKILKN